LTEADVTGILEKCKAFPGRPLLVNYVSGRALVVTKVSVPQGSFRVRPPDTRDKPIVRTSGQVGIENLLLSHPEIMIPYFRINECVKPYGS
jgi:hypothetical protein